MQDITALIVNYRTLELTARCVESLLAHYPRLELLLVDNGSGDASTSYIQGMAARYANIAAILNPCNRFHGPALDQGLRAARSRRVLTLDSDCEVLEAGFLEAMSALFDEDARLYAAGELAQVNRFGYPVPPARGRPMPYVQPRCMLLDRDKYATLEPFTHHGAPGLRNMRAALRRGCRLLDFPVQAYVSHLGRGTCAQYGYGLGLRHKIEHLLNRAWGARARDGL